MGPTFGGINREDIKARNAFIIEQRLKDGLWISPRLSYGTKHGYGSDLRRPGFDQRAAPLDKKIGMSGLF